MTFIFKNRCAKYFIIVLLLGSASSCTEVWDLKTDGDNSEVAHTLCVAANATIAGGELSFAAAVAPVRSHMTEFDTHPIDSLYLELYVNGISYRSDVMVRDSLFGSEMGFIMDSIPITDCSPDVRMVIRDKANYYNTVSASRKVLEKPKMNARIAAVPIPAESWFPKGYIEKWKTNEDRLYYTEMQGPDSLYRAEIDIEPMDFGLHYYLLSVEFEYYNSIALLTSPDKYNYVKLGEVPFYSDDNLFFDSKITSSLSGFPVYFSNVFNNKGYEGGRLSATIQFRSPAPELLRTANGFICNAQVPFHIYLSELNLEEYDYYKSMQHNMCSSSSIFYAMESIPSNIEGGIGFFSIHNMHDFFYLDNTLYNVAHVKDPVPQQDTTVQARLTY